jgi:hypothetical protein
MLYYAIIHDMQESALIYPQLLENMLRYPGIPLPTRPAHLPPPPLHLLPTLHPLHSASSQATPLSMWPPPPLILSTFPPRADSQGLWRIYTFHIKISQEDTPVRCPLFPAGLVSCFCRTECSKWLLAVAPLLSALSGLSVLTVFVSSISLRVQGALMFSPPPV